MATLVSKFTLDNTYNDDTANANHLLAAGTGNAFNIFNRKGSYSLDTNGSGFAQRTGVITGINTGNANRSFGGWINSSSIASVQSLIFLGTNTASQGHLIIILSATSIRVDLQSDLVNFTVPTMVNNRWYWVWTEYTAANKNSCLPKV